MQKNAPEIFASYKIIVLEKLDKTSIIAHDDICKYINELNKTGIDELILLGFSSGGVIASHVMTRLTHITCNKKLITYDTPFQVMDTVCCFQNNWICRLDYYFYYVVYNVYKNHYDYNNIQSWLTSSVGDSISMVKLIKNIHGFTDEQMYNITGFNMNLNPNIKIINILVLMVLIV